MKRHEDAQKAQMIGWGLAFQLKCICAFCVFLWLCCVVASAQDSRNLTPAQAEIEKHQRRLSSSDVEERREAVMRLGSMRLAAASRAALPGLQDASPIIRVTTAKAILSLGSEESARQLLPLLNDKDEFVRREAAYALGLTHSRSATAALSERLLNDKEDGVRGAAAVALGHIADEAAVIALVGTLAPELSAPSNKKRKRAENVFVLRAAAAALGQIRSRAGTAALIAALNNEKLPSDVRRESAHSLGLIGDPSAVSALKTATTAADPFLSEIAHNALKKLGQK
ncbi:MAG TPA: HEAT repeat domain-containing protein [Pyrinomonadaceae bacterium]|nr:HEAT repeat domain-containing protein [Pyrinomonadaceae bacterium]